MVSTIRGSADAALPELTGKSSDWGLQSRHLEWVEDFRARHGRAPRVLGIGNIANNAYRNTIALQAAGVESHVLCYDAWHIMGCPEWEEAHFDSEGLDDFLPLWSKVNLGGHQRPRWFAQGRLGTALDYLISLCEGAPQSESLWQRLEQEREAGGDSEPSDLYFQKISHEEKIAVAERLAVQFALTFPWRRDQLTVAEILHGADYLLSELARINRLLSHYDYVIGYSTDGMIPLMTGRRDYIAYEHGTIRLIPFTRNFQGRMCALTYALAGDVLITNCDNINAARRLNLSDFRFTPHAILEQWRSTLAHVALRRDLMAQYDADFIVFHPPRQHWQRPRDLNFDKANDVLIEAFARLVKETRPQALLIMVDWGQTVAQSRALIEELGVAERVVWIKPKPVRVMQEYVAASDVLADQFAIGAWGGIMPIGLMLGTPVLIYLDEDLHRWAFPQMPPIFNVRTVEDVLDALRQLLDPHRAQAVSAEGKAWYDRYHSLSVVGGRLIDSMLNVTTGPSEFARHEMDGRMLGLGRQIVRMMDPLSKLAARFDGETIPTDAVLVAFHRPESLFCSEYWANAGAAVRDVRGGRRLTTPAQAWHYAAAVTLDLSQPDFKHEHCWVRVYLRDIDAELRVAVYDPAANQIGDEIALSPQNGEAVVVLQVMHAGEQMLLFRSSAIDQSASATFSAAEVLAGRAYTPAWRPGRGKP